MVKGTHSNVNQIANIGKHPGSLSRIRYRYNRISSGPLYSIANQDQL